METSCQEKQSLPCCVVRGKFHSIGLHMPVYNFTQSQRKFNILMDLFLKITLLLAQDWHKNFYFPSLIINFPDISVSSKAATFAWTQ